MFVGHDHEMPAVIWKFVEDTKALFTPVNNEVFFVLIVLDCVTESSRSRSVVPVYT